MEAFREKTSKFEKEVIGSFFKIQKNYDG